jgi:hypothetical protein
VRCDLVRSSCIRWRRGRVSTKSNFSRWLLTTDVHHFRSEVRSLDVFYVMGTSPDEEGFSLVAEVLHLLTLGCTRRATYRRQTRATLQASHAARTLNLPNLAKLPHRTFAYSPFSQTSLLALPRTASNTVMFPLAMRTAVFQAILIHAASLILDNHLRGNTFDKMMENEVFMTMWNAVDKLAFKVTNNATHANGPGPLTLDAGNTTNTTLSLNQTIASNGGWQNLNPQPPFYCQRLPRELVVHMVIFALQYWWFVGLERILPARPRSKEVPRQRENKVELSEDREEEVVEKWIAQGKVQRASLSWCNTFLKWVLVMTVGELLLHTVAHVVREAISLSSPRSILAGLKSVSCSSTSYSVTI